MIPIAPFQVSLLPSKTNLYPFSTCTTSRRGALQTTYEQPTNGNERFTTGWLPKQFGPFDAAVSSSCLHNLRDFARISQIYREIREHLRASGIFLNLDLINAPTAGLRECYDAARARRRHRDGVPDGDVAAMIRRERAPATAGPFPADLDQQLAALKAAGFRDVDCFWKELGRALVGGYA